MGVVNRSLSLGKGSLFIFSVVRRRIFLQKRTHKQEQ